MARRGQDYIDALQERSPNLWIKGERVDDPTTHPATKGVVQSIAHLYDLQHDSKHQDDLTYQAPDGERAGSSFLIPKTKEDLRQRSAAYKTWANESLGLMGRTPDYLNAVLTAYGACADTFDDYADNVRNYYEFARNTDICTTHALTNPQVNRAKSMTQQSEDDPYIPVGIVEERDDGVVVRGARMLATLPVADEILVLPSTVLKVEEGADKYAVAFAIPTSTEGLHFICREPIAGDSTFDHPASSRFEEMDAICIFDDVLVPWERVFICRDVEAVNRAYTATNALNLMAHQTVVHKVAKTEAFLGLVSLMAEGISVDVFGHVQEKIAEVIVYLEAMRGFWTRAEQEAEPNDYGLMVPNRGALDGARNLYPMLYPRINEIVQQIGAGGMILQLSERDLHGPLGEKVEKFMQGRAMDAEAKMKLFRLAWDMTVSAFGARQTLYERFFFGDPVRMRMALFNSYDREPYRQRIRQFLDLEDEPIGKDDEG